MFMTFSHEENRKAVLCAPAALSTPMCRICTAALGDHCQHQAYKACLTCECIEVHILISCNDVDQAMLQNICLVTYMVCCAVVCCSVVASSSAQQCKTVQLSWVIQQDFHLSKLGARDSGLAPASRFATPMARHLASICRELNRCRSLGMRTLLGRSGKPDTSSSSCFGTSSQICTPKLSKQQHHCITDLNTKR